MFYICWLRIHRRLACHHWTGVRATVVVITIVVLVLSRRSSIHLYIPDSKLFLYLRQARFSGRSSASGPVVARKFPQKLGTGSHGTTFQIAARPCSSRYFRDHLHSSLLVKDRNRYARPVFFTGFIAVIAHPPVFEMGRNSMKDGAPHQG